MNAPSKTKLKEADRVIFAQDFAGANRKERRAALAAKRKGGK